MTNELLAPGLVPALDKIVPEDYMPAIDQAITDIQQQVQKIKNNPDPASFSNTVVLLDSLFDKISYISNILSNESANVYSDALAAVEETINIKVSGLEKNVFQDQAL